MAKAGHRMPQVQSVLVSGLIPYPNNARTHSAAQVAEIAASIREFGWTVPILIDENGGVLAGHGRLAAAKSLGMERVPVLMASGLTEAQKRAYILADNKLAENAGWDDALLRAELVDIQALGQDLKVIGFDERELRKVLGAESVEAPEPQIDKAAALQKKWKTKRGQIWEIGAHRLMCGDSTQLDDIAALLCGAKAEMLFTDPPYGVSYDGGHFHSGDVNIKRPREKLEADHSAAVYAKFVPLLAACVDGPCYVWFAGRNGLELFSALDAADMECHALIIWNKTNATYAAMNAQYKQRHEPCMYFKPKHSTLRWCGPPDECTVWDIARDPRNDLHPTQKPIALAARAITNHTATTVLDLFAGAAATMCAAQLLDRACYGMEIEPKYVAVSLERLSEMGLKPALSKKSKAAAA